MLPVWLQVLGVAFVGGVLGAIVVRAMSRFERRAKHVHRYIPQPEGEAPRCCDCGKVYR